MARKKANNGTAAPTETVGGYFRRFYTEHPEQLDVRSNDEAYRQWLADHPEHKDVPANVKAGLFNVKGDLRSKAKRQKRKASKEKAAPPAPQTAIARQASARPRSASRNLEALEEQIDNARIAAKTLDPEGLEEVIGLLREARNEVIRTMGE
jgi:hypothetical protein